MIRWHLIITHSPLYPPYFVNEAEDKVTSLLQGRNQMSNEMVIFSKIINKQPLVYPNMKDMPVLLIEGIFDGFELFPLNRRNRFV